jgi:cytoskeletal protein CcmA (bactofilin family)
MKAISVEANKEGSALFRRLFPLRENTEPPHTVPADPCVATAPSNGTFMPKQSGSFLSQGVSIKGSVKFLNAMFIAGEVEGTIDSSGTLTVGEHAAISGDIRTKSVNVRGTVEGNIFATERCELQANCTLHGDIEATWLVVSENATFRGHAKVGKCKSLSASRSPAEPNGSRLRESFAAIMRRCHSRLRCYDEAGNVIAE